MTENGLFRAQTDGDESWRLIRLFPRSLIQLLIHSVPTLAYALSDSHIPRKPRLRLHYSKSEAVAEGLSNFLRRFLYS